MSVADNAIKPRALHKEAIAIVGRNVESISGGLIDDLRVGENIFSGELRNHRRVDAQRPAAGNRTTGQPGSTGHAGHGSRARARASPLAAIPLQDLIGCAARGEGEIVAVTQRHRPGPFKPLPVVSVIVGCASIALVTPAFAMLNVPLPVIGPPVNPDPLATLVTVPVPAAAQAHAVPLYCSTCFELQAFRPIV